MNQRAAKTQTKTNILANVQGFITSRHAPVTFISLLGTLQIYTHTHSRRGWCRTNALEGWRNGSQSCKQSVWLSVCVRVDVRLCEASHLISCSAAALLHAPHFPPPHRHQVVFQGLTLYHHLVTNMWRRTWQKNTAVSRLGFGVLGGGVLVGGGRKKWWRGGV